MKKSLVTITTLLVSTPAIAFGENNAIEKNNYYVGARGLDLEQSKQYGGFAGARVNVASHIGAAIGIEADSYQNDISSQLDSDGKLFSGELFLRKYDLGKIGIRYNHSEMEAKKIDNKFRADLYEISAVYYLDNLDLLVSRFAVDPNRGNTEHHLRFGAGYYINDNLSARITGGMMASKESYSVGIEYQPEILNKGLSFGAGYDHSPDFDSRILFFRYYFDTRVNLKDRYRHY